MKHYIKALLPLLLHPTIYAMDTAAPTDPVLQSIIKHGILCNWCPNYKGLAEYITRKGSNQPQEFACKSCCKGIDYQYPLGGLISRIKESATEELSCEICYEQLRTPTVPHLFMLTCCATQDSCKLLCTTCRELKVCPFCREPQKTLAVKPATIEKIKTHLATTPDTNAMIESIFIHATHSHNIEIAASCLPHTINPELRKDALFRCSTLSLARLLIEQKTPIHVTNKSGLSLIHSHILRAKPAFDVIAYLLRSGADASAVTNNLTTPLHYLAQTSDRYNNTQLTRDLLAILIAFDADHTAQDEKGNTPLHTACIEGNAVVAQELVIQGAQLHTKNIEGKSPYDIASLVYPNTILPILTPALEKQPISKQGKPSAFLTVLHQINETNLADHNTEYSEAPSLIAACHPRTHSYLLRHALIKKAYRYTKALFDAAYGSPQPIERLKLLFAHHHNTPDNIAGYQGLTGLDCLTSAEDKLTCMNYLLDCGTMPDCQSEAQETALHYYAKGDSPHNYILIERLLKHGASANHESKNKRTPLHNVKNAAVAKLLLTVGNAQVNHNNCGLTPLHIACTTGNNAVVSVLLEHGAAINSQDALYQETPLHLSMARGHFSTSSILLTAGADASIKNYNGQIPADKLKLDKNDED